MSWRWRFFCPAAALLFLTACGGDAGSGEPAVEAAAEPAVAMPQREVTITSPAEGQVVEGPSVGVLMGAHGFVVVPAGDTTHNSGHLHLFLDRDLSPVGIPIPKEEGHIIHLGTGDIAYTFESVPPGEHRLIAVVGDALHVPLQPWVVDTVRFTVR